MPTNKLYLLSTSFTFLCLGLFAYDFATYATHPVGNNFVVVYLCLLSAYAADKEIGRWTRAKAELLVQRKGSWFVVAWAVFYAAAYLAEYFQSGYKVPEGLSKVVISVVGVFFGTGLSKRYFAMLKGEAEPWNADEIKKRAEEARIKDEDEQRRQAILGLLKATPEGLTVPELVKGTSFSKRSIQRDVADLVKLGRIAAVGKARGTRYRLKRK